MACGCKRSGGARAPSQQCQYPLPGVLRVRHPECASTPSCSVDGFRLHFGDPGAIACIESHRLDGDEAESSIRFSLGFGTCDADVEESVGLIEETLARLSRTVKQTITADHHTNPIRSANEQLRWPPETNCHADAPDGHCQVDEKVIDRPPIYWAPARCKPAMQGIRNGRQPQLDNTFHELAAGLFMVGYDLRDA